MSSKYQSDKDVVKDVAALVRASTKTVDEVFKAYKTLVGIDLCYQASNKNAEIVIPGIGKAIIMNKNDPLQCDSFLSLSDDVKQDLTEINSKSTQYFDKQIDSIFKGIKLKERSNG